jgi:hypothetical protein
MKVRALLLTLAVSAVAIVACAGPDVTAPTERENASFFRLPLGGGEPKLIECPSSESGTASSVITTLGGTVSVSGASILIPAGALLSDALVTVTVPASKYVEVDISVAGSEHFLFELPVIVTISYARCARSNIDLSPLSAWYIDSETKALLEKMPSIDNKLLRTVTFTTEHLSGYAVAN